MKHQLMFDSESKILFGTTEGTATLEGFARYISELAGHPDLSSCVGIISDHRKLDTSPISSEEIGVMVRRAATHREKWLGKKHPIVVGEVAAFGLARMYEIVAEDKVGAQAYVCYTLEEARAWIMRTGRPAQA